MASDQYRVVDSYRTVETFGGLDSRDVERVVVQALPSGIAFAVQFTADEHAFNDPDLLAAATADIARPYSGYVDAAINDPNVAGTSAFDFFNESNQQVLMWKVTFASDNGQVQTTRDLAFIDIRPENFPAIRDQTVAALNRLAASGS